MLTTPNSVGKKMTLNMELTSEYGHKKLRMSVQRANVLPNKVCTEQANAIFTMYLRECA